jgi:hypothetical protein
LIELQGITQAPHKKTIMENSNTTDPRPEPKHTTPLRDTTDKKPTLPGACTTVPNKNAPASAQPPKVTQAIERSRTGERMGIPQLDVYRLLSANDRDCLATLLAVLKATGFRLP